jgi:hypothetical protein
VQPTLDDRFAVGLLAEVIEDLQSERATLHTDDANESDE